MFTFFNVICLIILGIPIYILSKVFSKTSIPGNLKELDGPRGYPFVGILFTIREPLWSYLHKASKTYGSVFKIIVGCREIVVLSSNKVLHKAFKEQGNIFSGRWQHVIVKTTEHNSGILFKDKELWATQRSFALKVLKDFGFGKQRSTDIINQECSLLLKEIEENCGKVISARFLFPQYMVNVISQLVMKMRFEKESDHFKMLTKIIETVAQNDNFFVTIILMYPIFEKFPLFTQLLLKIIGRQQQFDFVHNFIKDIIDEHRKHFNEENEGEDFIDMFLKEQHKLEKENIKNHTFTEWQLIRVGFELFVAGYETTSTTLTWSMLLMAKYPEIQNKIYNELKDVIGTERLPNMSDKKSLHYTQAVMDEIFRFSSVVPLALPHRVLENTEIEGYFIPKDSIVFPNLYACHRDENIWEKPFEFYPEHFLRKQENDEYKYTAREELVPFSIGKRQCLGEALARMEFFLFFTSILQKFKMKFEKEITEEIYSTITYGTDGIIRAPLKSDVIFEMRS